MVGGRLGKVPCSFNHPTVRTNLVPSHWEHYQDNCNQNKGNKNSFCDFDSFFETVEKITDCIAIGAECESFFLRYWEYSTVELIDTKAFVYGILEKMLAKFEG